MLKDFAQRFEAALEKRRRELADNVGDGKAKTLEAYREMVGERRGLKEAQEIARDIIDELVAED
jgi:F0F1-type ATP synthase membrane subunit b/b'